MYAITENCTKCRMCEQECPVEAVKEEESTFVIDQEICTDCGACLEICPVDAIVGP